jgi:hypothetical protein
MKTTHIENLERLVLELGTEIFQLKHQVGSLFDQNQKLLQAFDTMKKILEQKDIISEDEFKDNVDLQLSNLSVSPQHSEAELDERQEYWKKRNH